MRLATAESALEEGILDVGDSRRALGAFRGLLGRINEFHGSIWNFELFAVEDTVDIGGRPTSLSRGVTVGKSVGALLMFVVGYQIVSLLAGRGRASWCSASRSARGRRR